MFCDSNIMTLSLKGFLCFKVLADKCMETGVTQLDAKFVNIKVDMLDEVADLIAECKQLKKSVGKHNGGVAEGTGSDATPVGPAQLVD